jgi:hypothetical protein
VDREHGLRTIADPFDDRSTVGAGPVGEISVHRRHRSRSVGQRTENTEERLHHFKGSDTIEHMFEMIATIGKELGRIVAEIDPVELDEVGAADLVVALDRVERLAAAGKALAGSRVEASDAWRGSGARDAVGFLAARTDTTRGRVRDGLFVVTQLASMPLVDQAFRRGHLTIDQAADIVAAVSEHPNAEPELVALVGSVSARELKARCVDIMAEGDGAEQQHRRAQAERSASSNVGRDGIWRMSVRLPVIDGAFVDKALDHFQTQIFDDARRAGEREPFDAYRADALVAMARSAMGEGCNGSCGAPTARDAVADGGQEQSGKPRKRRRRPTRSSSIRHAIVVTVPHSLFQPGGLRPGETCTVPGVGPVPASVVHRLLDDDPIVKAVVTRGNDITAVATLTRTIKEDLRVAVLASNDLTCAVPGCTNTRFLQLDHELEYHKGGPTSYDNLRPLCTFHHHQRTREHYELKGTPGRYEWTAPGGSVLASDRARRPPSDPRRAPTAEQSGVFA